MYLGLISRIEKLGGQSSKGENAYGLELHCKDMRYLRFGFVPENHSRRLVYERLQQYAFPLSNGLELFAFTARLGDCGGTEDGWTLFDATREFNRQVRETCSSGSVLI